MSSNIESQTAPGYSPSGKAFIPRVIRLCKTFSKIIILTLALILLAMVIVPLWAFKMSMATTLNNLKAPIVYSTPAHAKVNHGTLGWWRSFVRDWKLNTGRYDNFQTRDEAYRPVVGVICEGDPYVWNGVSREYVRSSTRVTQ